MELHYLGPGDGDATTIVYLPQEKVLVTSDMYEDMAISDAGVIDDKNFTGTRKILGTARGRASCRCAKPVGWTVVALRRAPGLR